MESQLEPVAPTAPLTDSQIAGIAAAVADSKAPATRRAYSGAVRAFGIWCVSNGQPALPTNPAVVAAYLVERADSNVSLSTLTVAVAGIRDAHLSAGHANPTAHRGVTQTMAGLRRRLGTAPSRQARAFDVGELRRILAKIDRSSTAGKRDAALLLFLFSSACRRSEAAALMRGDLQLSPAGIRVAIRRSKSDQAGAGAVVGVPAGVHQATDPLRAMRQWLGVRGGASSDPVFCRVSRTGAVLEGGLTGQSVNTILQARAAAAGVELAGLSAHSTRASHVTAAAKAGVPLEDIQRQTRHANVQTLLGYVRSARVVEDAASAGSLGL
ncbi:site-specific integrase [Cryobacterium sp. PH31-O1]|uniref:site-specific integrase n=1 Tax=Cryobacterium sp. PH31-O1 TaxID=3046306 RepID=UPI0024BBE147|nr:site-specific integrase [Cryobacterium sp. PH31-O1]MDJ0338244.1 site-specific integrase [Cryobacterium sp. PH31-O1]